MRTRPPKLMNVPTFKPSPSEAKRVAKTEWAKRFKADKINTWQRIIDARAVGLTNVEACAVAGTSVAALTTQKEKLPRFADMLETAMAHAEMYCTVCILQAASTDWKAAAWYLERRFREKYGKGEPVGSEPRDVTISLGDKTASVRVHGASGFAEET